MNKYKIVLLVAIAFLLMVVFVPAAGHPNDLIIIDNADTARTINTTISNDLLVASTSVGPRIVIEFANILRTFALEQIPGPLQALLGNISERLIFEFANLNREFALNYPLELIGDNTSPQVSNVAAVVIGANSAEVTWATDEFANSEVMYGTQPGNYSETVSDPLYYKSHAITLSGIIPGTTYYYKVRSTDQSGNTVTSSEYSFTALISVYLPMTVK